MCDSVLVHFAVCLLLHYFEQFFDLVLRFRLQLGMVLVSGSGSTFSFVFL